MYHIRFNSMTVAEFNEKLVLKHAKKTQNEIEKAVADICLSHKKFSVATHHAYEKAIESICAFIQDNDLLGVAIYNYFEELIGYFAQDYCEMEIEQFKAINDYCYNEGYKSGEELLSNLIECGIMNEKSIFEDLASSVNDTSYETMYAFLEEA